MARLSDADFLALGEQYGWSAERMHKACGIAVSMIHKRIRSLQDKGVPIARPRDKHLSHVNNRIPLAVTEGTVLVGSDAHYWPGHVSTAHRAFVRFTKELKPAAIVLNGDICDFPELGRFDPLGFQRLPTVKEELEAVQDRLADIEKVAANARLLRTTGNHDMRFERRLAMAAPEYEGVAGFALADQIPRWTAGRSVWVNENECVITHRWHNGIHAVWNNVLKSGVRGYVTGHLHSLKVTPYTDLVTDRYGVDTGTLCDVYADQFGYAEDSPRNWRSGFAVLTFAGGKLMPPELVQVVGDGKVFFRGKVSEV